MLWISAVCYGSLAVCDGSLAVCYGSWSIVALGSEHLGAFPQVASPQVASPSRSISSPEHMATRIVSVYETRAAEATRALDRTHVYKPM
jgi:hypothetical protein